MVPVSIRTGDEEDTWTNRVSGLVVDLPTNLADPLERVARCREAMLEAKQQFELVPAEALIDIQQYTPPVVATSAIRLAARLGLANRVDPVVNVIISNVPGPRQPLYLGRAKLDQYIPVSTIAEGMGLNITVHSYLDEFIFGLVSCRELVPDLWHMVDLHVEEIDVLFKATGAEYAVPPRPAPPRGRKKAAAKKAPAAKKARGQEGAGQEGGRQEARRRAKKAAARKRAPATS